MGQLPAVHRRDEHNGGNQHDECERAHVERILPAPPWQTRGTMKKLLALVLVAAVGLAAWLVLNGRGHGMSGVTTTTPQPTMPVQAYFYLGAGLVPVTVQAPKTEAVATAALKALLAGPPSGYQTAIPTGLRFVELTIQDGVAHATLSRALERRTHRSEAQIVYTLTQFPSVRRVEIAIQNQGRVAQSDSVGQPLDSATRADYLDQTQTAPIFVTSPIGNSTVTSPVAVRGTAVVFEATFMVDIFEHGKLLRTQPITTSLGAPERGTWSLTLTLPPGDVELRFYEPSAKDGSHLHETGLFFTVKQ
jgi:hypothetical protein